MTNVGATPSPHVALLFGIPPANAPGSAADVSMAMPSPPRQVLLGFERLPTIEPNMTMGHTFSLTARHWELSDSAGEAQHTAGCWSLVLGESSTEVCV